jgi:hypothetical protein
MFKKKCLNVAADKSKTISYNETLITENLKSRKLILHIIIVKFYRFNDFF